MEQYIRQCDGCRFGRLRLDDKALIGKFMKFTEEIQEKKRRLDKITKKKDSDYLSVLLARLSYKFSKEEYDALFSEIERRGLTI